MFNSIQNNNNNLISYHSKQNHDDQVDNEEKITSTPTSIRISDLCFKIVEQNKKLEKYRDLNFFKEGIQDFTNKITELNWPTELATPPVTFIDKIFGFTSTRKFDQLYLDSNLIKIKKIFYNLMPQVIPTSINEPGIEWDDQTSDKKTSPSSRIRSMQLQRQKTVIALVQQLTNSGKDQGSHLKLTQFKSSAVRALKHQLKNENALLQELEDEKSNLMAEIQKGRIHLEDHEKSNSKLQAEIKNLQDQISNLKRVETESEKTEQNKQSEIKRLEDLITTLEINLANSNHEYEKSIRQLTQDLENAEKTKQNEIEKLNGQINNLKIILENYNLEHEVSIKQLIQLLKNNETCKREEIINLENQMKLFQTNHIHSIQELEQEISELKQQLANSRNLIQLSNINMTSRNPNLANSNIRDELLSIPENMKPGSSISDASVADKENEEFGEVILESLTNFRSTIERIHQDMASLLAKNEPFKKEIENLLLILDEPSQSIDLRFVETLENICLKIEKSDSQDLNEIKQSIRNQRVFTLMNINKLLKQNS